MRSNISLRAVLVFSMAVAILGLAATTANAADKYWDGAGTWDTSTANWSLTSGGTYDQLWVSGDNAIFEGTPGTVTLGEAITATDITFASATSGYTISGNTLDLTGGTIDSSITSREHTITSAITGSPLVNIAANGGAYPGGGYKGLTFAPTSGTVTLGTATVPLAGGDKAGLTLGGTTTGNSVSIVQFVGGQYGTLRKNDTGTWSVGDVYIGMVYVNAGNLIANGSIRTRYADLQLKGGVFHFNNDAAVDTSAHSSQDFYLNGGSFDNTSGGAIVSTTDPRQLWSSAGVTFIGTDDLDLGTGAVVLSGSPTMTIQAGTLTIGGAIGHSAATSYGFTKAGAGTLVLGGANTYEGDTTLDEGTLTLSQDSLSDTGKLYVTSTASLNLAHSATDTVFGLFVDDVLQPIGTYDSTSPWLTGTGSIYNSGGLLPAGTYNWDGPGVGGTGDGVSDGGTGTWSTSTASWDVGITDREAWDNTAGATAEAIFRGTAGTVTVDGAITVKDIVLEAKAYTIDGGVLNFAAGGSIVLPGDGYTNVHTITSEITGSPTVSILQDNGGKVYPGYPNPGYTVIYKGLTFAPTSGTVTLGAADLRGGLWLGGTTTGNEVAGPITQGSQRASLYKKDSGTWTVNGDVNVGTVAVDGGTLIINGTLTTNYNHLHIFSGGRLGGNLTYLSKSFTVKSGGIMAPGDPTIDSGIGTMTTLGPLFEDGSIYEWEVGETATDIINITAGTLDLDNFILKIFDAGGSVASTDQLSVFTYDTGVTIDMDGFGYTVDNFNTDDLGAGWNADSLSLVDGGAGIIYLTGLSNSLPGDADGDGDVDAADYIMVKTHFGGAPAAVTAGTGGDFNGNGTVDWEDFQTLMAGMSSGTGGAPIPEPATLGLLALGALAVIRRRRK